MTLTIERTSKEQYYYWSFFFLVEPIGCKSTTTIKHSEVQLPWASPSYIVSPSYWDDFNKIFECVTSIISCHLRLFLLFFSTSLPLISEFLFTYPPSAICAFPRKSFLETNKINKQISEERIMAAAWLL